jgi:hypothetical protein
VAVALAGTIWFCANTRAGLGDSCEDRDFTM